MYIMNVTIPYICCQEVLINPLYVTSFTIAGMPAGGSLIFQYNNIK